MVTKLKSIPTVFDNLKIGDSILSKISIWKGDITSLEVDAIVNAANNGLRGGGGVDGAIHRAAGVDKLQSECRAIGHCDTGDAVITSGCNINHIKNIIHTVGPNLGSRVSPSAKDRELLLSCYKKSLDLAVQNNLSSIAFCCISTGVYGYPGDDAAKSVSKLLVDWLKENPASSTISRIVICCFNMDDIKYYEMSLQDLFN